jgi:ABC-type transport system substrate-binding protein
MARPHRAARLGIGLGLVAALLSGSAATLRPSPALAAEALIRARAAAGVLVYANVGIQELPSIDPVNGGDFNSYQAIGVIYSNLVKLDSNLHPVGDTASSWDVSADGLTYTFHLRHNVRFSDGTPVTAADVVYSFTRDMNPRFISNGHAALKHIVGAMDVLNGKAKTISGLKAVGTYDVQMTIDAPILYFPELLSRAQAGIVDRQVIAKYGEGKWYDHAIGSGPWMIKSWQHGQGMTLVPNPYYFGPKPALKEYDMPFIQNPETAYSEYQTGQIDVDNNVPATEITNAAGVPGFQQAAQLATDYIGLNTHIAPFDQIAVRQAFLLATDRVTLATKILKGGVVAADGLLPPTMPGWTKANQGLMPYNPAKARALLASAGHANGANMPPITFSFQAGSARDLLREGAVLQQMWQQNLGVKVSLNVVELGKYNNDLNSHNVQMYVIQWGADWPEPSNWLSLQLHSGQANNNGDWSNHQFDALVDQADVTRDTAKRFALYQQAERIAIVQVPWIPLDSPKSLILIRPSVKGFVLTGEGLNGNGPVLADWSKITNG